MHIYSLNIYLLNIYSLLVFLANNDYNTFVNLPKMTYIYAYFKPVSLDPLQFFGAFSTLLSWCSVCLGNVNRLGSTFLPN